MCHQPAQFQPRLAIAVLTLGQPVRSPGTTRAVFLLRHVRCPLSQRLRLLVVLPSWRPRILRRSAHLRQRVHRRGLHQAVLARRPRGGRWALLAPTARAALFSLVSVPPCTARTAPTRSLNRKFLSIRRRRWRKRGGGGGSARRRFRPSLVAILVEIVAAF